MLFNSYIFIFLFFPLVLLGYYGLNYIKKEKLSLFFLLGMSFWFYGYSNLYYLILLIISICVNFGLTFAMERKPNFKKALMMAGVFYNLGVLGYFKYFDFFLDNINRLFKTEIPFLKVALPIGISFFTFQQISYVVDFYHGECERYSFLEYANYVSFFPQLIAGPIVYHTELIPQFRDSAKKRFNPRNMSKGMYAFALGLGKKVLIADVFSKIVNIGYGDIENLNSISAILVILCYTLQIYFDFSGYSDMAIGLGLMCNIELPINFNSPYKSASIGEFWNRWHITLNRFLTKYVYIPLGGNRKGMLKTCINVMIVFLLSGLWHGANWTFVCWGAINGFGIVVNKLLGNKREKLPSVLRKIGCFGFVSISWVMFRASSIGEAITLMKRIFIGGTGTLAGAFCDAFNGLIEMKALYRLGFGMVIDQIPWMFLTCFLLLVLYFVFFRKNTQEKIQAMKFSFGENLLTVFLLFYSIMSLSEMSEFLYYNF